MGLELNYQSYVQALDASLGGQFNCFFQPYQRVAFDRLWPARFMRIDLYTDSEEDFIHEAYYTAALWQIVGRQVIDNRNRLDTYLISSAYVVGYGKNPCDDESRMLSRHVDLCLLDLGNGK